MKFRLFSRKQTISLNRPKPDLVVELLAFVVLVTLAFVVIYTAINFQSLVEFRELS